MDCKLTIFYEIRKDNIFSVIFTAITMTFYKFNYFFLLLIAFASFTCTVLHITESNQKYFHELVVFFYSAFAATKDNDFDNW